MEKEEKPIRKRMFPLADATQIAAPIHEPTSKAKEIKYYRLNLGKEDDIPYLLRVLAAKKGVSIARYMNELIRREAQNEQVVYIKKK